MIVLVVAVAALAVALVASLASGRDGVVVGVRAVLNGAAGFALWFVWLLAPWLIGVGAARLIRRARA